MKFSFPESASAVVRLITWVAVSVWIRRNLHHRQPSPFVAALLLVVSACGIGTLLKSAAAGEGRHGWMHGHLHNKANGLVRPTDE